MTGIVVQDGARELRKAVPALLGIAALAVVAAGAAVLIGRAGRSSRKQPWAPKQPSFLGEVARTVVLNVIGMLATRLVRRVPLALLAADSEQHAYAAE